MYQHFIVSGGDMAAGLTGEAQVDALLVSVHRLPAAEDQAVGHPRRRGRAWPAV